MAIMTTAEAWSDIWPHEDRPLTVTDLERVPDDGNRYELDDGMLIVSPAPFNNHQFVVARLQMILGLACPPEFIVLSGPGLNLSATQHRVPDLAVVRTEGFKIDYVFEARPPLLAVEVSSRSTALYDHTRKKAVYEQYRIPSYWIVTPDPERPAVTIFELADGRYRQIAQADGDGVLDAALPFPVSVIPALLVNTDPLR
jgi:Uma2 family endonuclease